MGFNTTKRKLNNILTSLMVKYLYNFVDSKNNFKPKVKLLPSPLFQSMQLGLARGGDRRWTWGGVRIRNLKENTQQFYFLLNNEEK